MKLLVELIFFIINYYVFVDTRLKLILNLHLVAILVLVSISFLQKLRVSITVI
jgi:hypothetical protein